MVEFTSGSPGQPRNSTGAAPPSGGLDKPPGKPHTRTKVPCAVLLPEMDPAKPLLLRLQPTLGQDRAQTAVSILEGHNAEFRPKREDQLQ